MRHVIIFARMLRDAVDAMLDKGVEPMLGEGLRLMDELRPCGGGMLLGEEGTDAVPCLLDVGVRSGVGREEVHVGVRLGVFGLGGMGGPGTKVCRSGAKGQVLDVKAREGHREGDEVSFGEGDGSVEVVCKFVVGVGVPGLCKVKGKEVRAGYVDGRVIGEVAEECESVLNGEASSMEMAP